MPESQDEFDQAWAQIVDDLTAGPPGANGDSTTAQDPAAPTDRAGGSPGDATTADRPSAPPPPAPPANSLSAGLEALFEPLRRRREQPAADRAPAPDDFVDNWEDEGHFVPPPPPEIPEGTPIKRLAWAGVLGGPLIILLIALTGWDPPSIVGISAGLATLAGFVTLVWQLPEAREDGWDDGARL
jgi:hypothetical protein